MRGDTNFAESSVTGDVLPPDRVNRLCRRAASADDEVLFSLLGLEPPGAASPTQVGTAVVFLREGAAGVVGSTSARRVTVAPARVLRTSTSVSEPREMVSATIDDDTDVSLPAAPTAGQWGYLLLYAQLAYVDPSEPTRGTQATLLVAEPSYVSTASAPNFAALPANTSSPPTWNVPLRYVRTVGGQTTIAQEDILEIPHTAGFASLGHRVLRLLAKLVSTHRVGYSSANSSPLELVSGGGSAWLTKGLDQQLTPTRTPLVIGRHDSEWLRREFKIPAGPSGSGGGTAGTGGVADEIVLDDTRDWRGARFEARWYVSLLAAHHWSEDEASASGGQRAFPVMAQVGLVNGVAKHETIGNSFLAQSPHATFGSALWASVVGSDSDVPGIGPQNGVTNTFLSAGEGWGLKVHPTTGALIWWAKRGGTGSGPPVWIVLDAYFDHTREP